MKEYYFENNEFVIENFDKQKTFSNKKFLEIEINQKNSAKIKNISEA